MLTTHITLAEKYDYLTEKFRKAYAFLRRSDLADLPAGTTPIDGDEIFANIQHYTTTPAEELQFESHDSYFDIQFIVEGEELFGYAARDGLEVSVPYDAQKDLTFYHDPETPGYILLKKGDFAVVPPEDAHKPRCALDKPCAVKKIVIKVKL